MRSGFRAEPGFSDFKVCLKAYPDTNRAFSRKLQTLLQYRSELGLDTVGCKAE
jgi:hypothetical protein